MRVVIVGGSGNVGTALLRQLVPTDGQTEDIDSIAGVARRPPPTSGQAPYGAVDWHRVDIGADTALDGLRTAFRGADAVVHLGWAIQPSHDQAALRRTNILGSRNVAHAAVDCDVPHLVYASSVGAYAPHPRPDAPVDERWPVTGVPGSTYSEQKAEVEQLLDRMEAAGDSPRVTRMRPGLSFQGMAASQIARYFIGPYVPLRPLRWHRVPVLPLPHGLRVQVVHTDDVAAAYVSALRLRASGAFNLAAPPVLTAAELGRLLHGRPVPIPYRAAHAAAKFAWQLRVQPTEPGWVRLAEHVPVLDCTRAHTELGWWPNRDAHETVRELLDAMAHGSGGDSAPLRRRGPLRSRVHAAGTAASA